MNGELFMAHMSKSLPETLKPKLRKRTMADCPNCEYHRKRAQLWRDEAYKQAGHPLPEREWVGLTDEEIKAFDTWHDNREEEIGWVNPSEIVAYIEAKLKEKNT
jgi:hypothetical protein